MDLHLEKGSDLLTFKDAVSNRTDSFPLNSVMSPRKYQISKEIKGGKFDAEDVDVYAVKGFFFFYRNNKLFCFQKYLPFSGWKKYYGITLHPFSS